MIFLQRISSEPNSFDKLLNSSVVFVVGVLKWSPMVTVLAVMSFVDMVIGILLNLSDYVSWW